MGLFIEKDTTLSDTIKTGYHRIGEFSFNSFTGRTLVTVFSFISESDADAGKAPYSQATYELSSVNPLQLIEQSQVGTPLMLIVQQMLETAIVADAPEFSGAIIG
jgi:hypothetical protein